MSTALTTTESSSPALLPAKTIYGKTGKALGTVQHFSSNLGAKEIREQFKASGMKGKELTEAVNKVLRGEKDLRGQLTMAWVEAALQQGMVADRGVVKKNTATLSFVRVGEEVAAPVLATMKTEDILSGLTPEQLEELTAAVLAKGAK